MRPGGRKLTGCTEVKRIVYKFSGKFVIASITCNRIQIYAVSLVLNEKNDTDTACRVT
jgi:hypothetical protein